MKIVVGSRDSQLAMMQTRLVKSQLEQNHENVDITIKSMKTIGDQRLDVALSKIGEKSLFTKELEFALMEKEVAFVVHSCKDLPTTLPPGMKIAAIMEREDPRDAVVMSSKLAKEGKTKLSDLPSGSIIGSSSLRRQAQLRARYPGLQIESVRGNLNTRLRKLDGEHETCKIDYSAIILAAAGLNRMETQNEAFRGRLSSHLETSECMYAVSQGALAIEILEGDTETAKLLQCLHHTQTALKIVAERAFMRTLDGGCSSPIAVFCDLQDDKLLLRGGVFSVDGAQRMYEEMSIDLSVEPINVDYQDSYTDIIHQNVPAYKMHLAHGLGVDLAERMMAKGADKIITAAKIANKPENNPQQAPQCPFPMAAKATKAIGQLFG